MMNECEHWKHFLFGNIEIMLSFRDRTCIWSISIYLEEYIYWYRFNHGGHQGRTRVVFRVQKKRFTCRRRYWTAIGKNDFFFGWPALLFLFISPRPSSFRATLSTKKKNIVIIKKKIQIWQSKILPLIHTWQNSPNTPYFFFFFNISVLIKCQVCIFMKNVINCFS